MSEDTQIIPNSIQQTTRRFERIDAASDARQKRRKGSGWTRGRQILADISKLVELRHGGPCDSDDGGIWVQAAIPSIADISGGLEGEVFSRRLEDWARIVVPRIDAAELAKCVAEARARNERDRLFWTAADLGDMLNVTTVERERLGLRTIRPGGMTPAGFEAYRRSRKTAGRQALRRAAAAVTPLPAVAIESTKPWVEQGVHRATWFRRQAARAKPLAAITLESERPWEALGISRRTWFRKRKAAIMAENGTGTATATQRVANRSEGSPIATKAVPPAQERSVLGFSRGQLNADPVWAQHALMDVLGTAIPAAQRTRSTGQHRSSQAIAGARASRA